MSSVSRILTRIEAGEPAAAADLLPLVYDELRRLAARKMAQEKAEHTLDPTALVHEAWLRLVGNPAGDAWNSRGHFYSAAAEAMRRILVEAARQKASLKRGGQFHRVELRDVECDADVNVWTDLLALDQALSQLQSEDPDCHQLVLLRYFSGLTVDQAAEVMGVSPRTAKRNWSFARAWLQRAVEGTSPSGEPR